MLLGKQEREWVRGQRWILLKDSLIPDLLDTCDYWERRAKRAEQAYFKQSAEVDQVLGKALGYPWYKDDPANWPNATEADGVCTGEHVPETLAAEIAERLTEAEQGATAQAQFAATWLARLSKERDRLRAALERIASHDGDRWDWTDDGPHPKDTPQEIAQQALQGTEAS